MALKRPKRGISVGTIVVLSLTVLALIMGGAIFLRISGDMGEIQLDTRKLTDQFAALSLTGTERDVIDTQPVSTGGGGEEPESGAGVPFGEPDPTAAPTPEPTKPVNIPFVLTAAGQVSLGAELRSSGQTTGGYEYASAFAPVSSVFAASDLSVVTLRTGLSDNENEYDAYRAPSAISLGLRDSGVTLLNLGTDRAMDHGVDGISTTLDTLARQGIDSVGASKSGTGSAPKVIDVAGVQMGVVSYTTTISAAGQKAATEGEINAAVRPYSEQTARTDISTLKSQGADMILVLIHWGARGDTKASAETRAIADVLVSAGADIILGTGPTNVGELERRQTTDSLGLPKEVFIAYSLGNFLIDESRDTGDITGVILQLQITWDTQSNRATITGSWYMPAWIMRARDDAGVYRYRIVPAGASSTPEGMTDSIYINMKKSYQSMVNRLGNTAAEPKTDP